MNKELNQSLQISIVILMMFLVFYLGSLVESRYNYIDYLNNNNAKVELTNDVKQTLKGYFVESEGKEYAVCLEGYKENNVTIITGTDKFLIGDEDSVKFLDCSDEMYVGYLHKHPKGESSPSLPDIQCIFKYDKEISIIHYELNKLSIKTLKNWYRGFTLKI